MTDDKSGNSTARVYRAMIGACKASGGIPPTLRELVRITGMSSTSVVNYHLYKLEEAGLVYRLPGAMSRGLMVTGGSWTPPAGWENA